MYEYDKRADRSRYKAGCVAFYFQPVSVSFPVTSQPSLYLNTSGFNNVYTQGVEGAGHDY